MHRIDSDGTAVALPTPGAVGATVGYFTEGNPGTGVPATVVSADWANAIQEEILAVIVGAGLSADKTLQTQLYSAIKRLRLSGAVNSVSSANYTVTTTDDYRSVFVSTGAADRTITLPASASSSGRVLSIAKTDSGVGGVIIDPNSAELIDGVATKTLRTQYEAVTIQCDGTGWHSVSKAGSTAVGYAAKSADYTVTLADGLDVIAVTTAATDRTITLPAAASCAGRVLQINKADSAVGLVIVDGNASETIAGNLTVSLMSQYNFVQIVSNGTGWDLLSYRIHEYVYNSDTTSSDDTTNFAYGTAGALMPNRSVGTTVSKRCRCKTTIGVLDQLSIEVLDTDGGNTTRFQPLHSSNEIMPLISFGAKNYGVGVVIVNSTDVEAQFSNGGYSANAAATYGANGNAWSALFGNGYKWRIVREVVY
jgi:hypothetical protein